jgi:hypothetical protein
MANSTESRWVAVEAKGRGWYVRKPIEGATATPYEYVGPMGDMCAPERLLSEEQAREIAIALNTVDKRHQVVVWAEEEGCGCGGLHCVRCGTCGFCICYAR